MAEQVTTNKKYWCVSQWSTWENKKTKQKLIVKKNTKQSRTQCETQHCEELSSHKRIKFRRLTHKRCVDGSTIDHSYATAIGRPGHPCWTCADFVLQCSKYESPASNHRLNALMLLRCYLHRAGIKLKVTSVFGRFSWVARTAGPADRWGRQATHCYKGTSTFSLFGVARKQDAKQYDSLLAYCWNRAISNNIFTSR